MEDEDAPVATDWRKDGRCSACRFFAADFGEPPELYGHCKMHPRPGAREATDYACPEYRPLPGFAALTESVKQDRLVPSGTPSATRGPAPAISRAPRQPRIIRRRRGEDGSLREDERRATPEVDPGVISAVTGLSGQGGSGVDKHTLRDALVHLVENFLAIEDVELGRKWLGGTLVLQPADPDLKPTEIPLESLFHKVVMIRDRLRVLEAKINSHDKLDDADKLVLHKYITGCYGSLTTFNVLFKNREDKFSTK